MAVFIYGCKKFENVAPSGDGPAPKLMTNISVTNTYGGAIISYTIPDDPNFLYARAEYETSPGVKASIKAASFSSNLNVEGMGDTLEHIVKLYTVSKTEKSSEPIEVKVNPLTPNYIQAFRSLQVSSTFGGVRITGVNIIKEDLILHPLIEVDGAWVEIDRAYSNDSLLNFIYRKYNGIPFDTINYRIGMYISDKWQHYSDTVYSEFKPVYETLLDPTKMNLLTLPGDAEWLPSTYFQLWVTPNINRTWPYGITMPSAELSKPKPVTFTIDNLGGAYSLSRIVIYPWEESLQYGNGYYTSHSPKIFEVWGCADNEPDSSGDYSNWNRLGRFEVIKPSGLPLGQENQSDKDKAYNGWEFDFAQNGISYKFLRIRPVISWNGANDISMVAFRVYGKKDQ